MRIVVAPDSFKESMAVGVRDALPMCLVDQVPVSDGGEGFAEAVTAAWDASWQEVTTVDALGRPRTAGFGRASDRAVIDLASSVGLEHILPGERDVMRSSTIGLGHVIAAAVDAGARSLLIGLGGSASNDLDACGTGRPLPGRTGRRGGAGTRRVLSHPADRGRAGSPSP